MRRASTPCGPDHSHPPKHVLIAPPGPAPRPVLPRDSHAVLPGRCRQSRERLCLRPTFLPESANLPSLRAAASREGPSGGLYNGDIPIGTRIVRRALLESATLRDRTLFCDLRIASGREAHERQLPRRRAPPTIALDQATAVEAAFPARRLGRRRVARADDDSVPETHGFGDRPAVAARGEHELATRVGPRDVASTRIDPVDRTVAHLLARPIGRRRQSAGFVGGRFGRRCRADARQADRDGRQPGERGSRARGTTAPRTRGTIRHAQAAACFLARCAACACCEA